MDSTELSPVVRRMFRRARRDLHEIPRQPPGTVLVFQLGDTYDVLPDGLLRLDAQVVVDAVAVAVVSTAHTLREAVAFLPAVDPRICIAVRARFHCWVTDPQLVLDAGCWDLEPFLTEHLAADRRLRFMAQSMDLAAGWQVFQRNATARLFAHHEIHPLAVPGLMARLVDVAIEPQRLGAAPWWRDRTNRRTARPPRAPGQARAAEEQPRERGTRSATVGQDGTPPGDGNPAFVPDHYSWGEMSD
jgi:hypothetical protein